MFLLSVHGGIQLGKYSVYNTLCLQLTFLINCNRNTAISSLIAGRIQLYISSLSRTQKLWLPNFQRERIGREVFYRRVTGGGGGQTDNIWNGFIESCLSEKKAYRGWLSGFSICFLLNCCFRRPHKRFLLEVVQKKQCNSLSSLVLKKPTLLTHSLKYFLKHT